MSSAITTNVSGQTQVNFIPTVGRRMLSVVGIEDISPNFRRITLGGEDLAGGFPFVDFAPTDHVKVFFPNPETGELIVPLITEQGWQYPEGADEPIFRDYTVRAFDAEAAELTLDFVLHNHGVGGVWATNAQLGDRVGVLGPRGNILFPRNYDKYVVAGDETALPALSRFLVEAPEHIEVTAFIEVEDSSAIHTLSGSEAHTVHWVCRDSASVGTGHLSALETAVRAASIDASERVFVFAAGEAGALKPIRQYLRKELGLSKEQVDVDGYWKRGTVNLDHHSNELSDDED